MSLYRTVSEINGDFGRKSQFFSNPPCILRPRRRGSHWNSDTGAGVKKLELWGYRAEKEI